MKRDLGAILFLIVWLAICTYMYVGHIWGNLAERGYRRTPRFFRQVVPGREADMETWVSFRKAMMKVYGPLGLAFGILMLLAEIFVGK